MSEMSRREALMVGLGAVAAASFPSPAARAAVAVAAPAIDLKAWAVGSIDEWDWRHVNARTEHEAKLLWLKAEPITDVCGQPGRDDCDCEYCTVLSGLEADRKPSWDGKVEASKGDWLRADMGACCSRCGEETYMHGDDPGYAVGDLAICSECMTLADWDIVDPGKAADIREELADDEAAA